MTRATTELVEVRLLELPVPLWAAAQQHTDELLREFTLMTTDGSAAADDGSVPDRLVALVQSLTAQFAGDVDVQRAELFAAAADGRTTLDLSYRLPAAAAGAIEALDRMLDEADEYCRAGRHLLTLATPPEIVAYRKWHLRSFVEQLGGGPAVPWPAFRDRRG